MCGKAITDSRMNPSPFFSTPEHHRPHHLFQKKKEHNNFTGILKISFKLYQN